VPAMPSVLASAVEAPWGLVHVAAGPAGLLAVELMAPRQAFMAGIERRLGRAVGWVEPGAVIVGAYGTPATVDANDPAAMIHLRAAATALAAAFAGDDGSLTLLQLDLDDRPAWDRLVLGAIRAIPRGEVRSYGQIAGAIGRPGAARAVGGAVGRNPIGFVIPCHRVIAGDGTLGGYGGGWWGEADRLLDLKAELLAREGRAFPRRANGGRRER